MNKRTEQLVVGVIEAHPRGVNIDVESAGGGTSLEFLTPFEKPNTALGQVRPQVIEDALGMDNSPEFSLDYENDLKKWRKEVGLTSANRKKIGMSSQGSENNTAHPVYNDETLKR